MRLDIDADGLATVRVSIHNLRSLIVKSSIPASAGTIVSSNCYYEGERMAEDSCTLYMLLSDEVWAAVDALGVAVCLTSTLAEWLARGPAETRIDAVTVIVEDDQTHYRGRPPRSLEPRTEKQLRRMS